MSVNKRQVTIVMRFLPYFGDEGHEGRAFYISGVHALDRRFCSQYASSYRIKMMKRGELAVREPYWPHLGYEIASLLGPTCDVSLRRQCVRVRSVLPTMALFDIEKSYLRGIEGLRGCEGEYGLSFAVWGDEDPKGARHQTAECKTSLVRPQAVNTPISVMEMRFHAM